MSQWITLLQKELVEMWRNFKWLWVPITFILLGVKEPLTSYYMQPILDALGGLPKGAVIKLPEPSAAEVLVEGLSSYTSIGVLIIVLTTMGIIAGERKSGVAAMILVKPVSFISYVTAKWMGGLILLVFSFFIGYLATWYYTGILFEWISFGDFLHSFLLYSLWLGLILTFTVFCSSLFLVPGTAGFISIATVLIYTLISGTLTKWMKWSPSMLTDYANQLLAGQSLPTAANPAAAITVTATIILLTLSVVVFRKKELAA
ncbi:ABC transporter permease [Bacillus sp. C11]|nr:ABC transporter permease [Neobacillus terrae]